MDATIKKATPARESLSITPDSNFTTLQSAIKKNWHIFPLSKNAKIPAKGSAGFHDALVRDEAVEMWPDIHAGNIGLFPGASGLLVIDVDVKTHKDGKPGVGIETMKALQSKYGKLPETLTIKTPSGGWHLYFQKPDVGHVGNDSIGKDIDIRCDGGYVLTPGCHVIDQRYEGFYEVTKDKPIAALPEAWAALFKPKPKHAPRTPLQPANVTCKGSMGDYSPASRVDVQEALTYIPADLPYDEWIKILAALKAAGFDDLAHEWSAGSPQYDPAEVEQKLASFNSGGVTIATVFHYAKKGGYKHAFSAPAPASKKTPDKSMADTVRRLAELPPLEYDQARVAEAKALSVRPATLDAEVKAARKDAHSDDGMFPEVDPWSESVDGGALLDEIAATFRRYVILPKHADVVAALWILNTYVHDASYHSPMIVLTSPEKRCGKTTAMMVFMALCNKPLPASNVSGAVVFRAIEQWHPTLLIDEVDSFLADKEDLRGVINSGHTKASASVLRCDGDNNEPKRFSTWCPKVLSGIGRVSDTLEDRSIMFPLRRKLPDEKVARLRLDRGGFDEIKQKCIRWGEDNFAKVAASDPATPSGLNDRAADNWTPLLAIADLCGWREQAEAAALALSGDADNSDSVNVMLLADVRKVFKARGVDRLPSQTLCDELAKMEDRPWPEWCKGRPITPRQIAKRLGGFGIHTRQHFQSGKNSRGYDVADFKDAFTRYCDSKRYSAKSEGTQQKTDFSKCYEPETLADKKSQNMKQGNTLSTIADRNATDSDSTPFDDADDLPPPVFDDPEPVAGALRI